MTPRIILIPRRMGRGGAYMHIPVHRARRCQRKAVRRMLERGAPPHAIARGLKLPRRVVARILSGVVWHG